DLVHRHRRAVVLSQLGDLDHRHRRPFVAGHVAIEHRVRRGHRGSPNQSNLAAGSVEVAHRPAGTRASTDRLTAPAETGPTRPREPSAIPVATSDAPT